MQSEWMKIMLEEIARKQLEAQEARLELQRRRQESAPPPGKPATPL